MKRGIHPEYRPVVFRDRAADHAFLTPPQALGFAPAGETPMTATSGKTVEWEDGNTYPVIEVEISSVSHPFCTGTQRVLDTAGRVERCQRRYERREP
ncbi:50S ribosomal protein L31 [Streptomyces natalensis]|uniref:50S ribosomal protein L31 n=1 Tax=Streptomyces natalensis ATCC 27448 TaxID=1240678 RepID=A0A0D7CJK7_9ACTN|nr:50S ribosomal protein L31 [Streptomyces natalensis]KIZ16419.1 50S ribosomal protein L31 [Streptomyces natalensis ATCC 27448]